jgi:glutamate synthase (NADPH/NADH) small chain
VDNEEKQAGKVVDRKERMAIPHQLMRKQKPAERIKNFDEVLLGYTKELAMKEAMRCIQCPKPKCVDACPTHNDIPGFIAKIEEGDFEGAHQIMMKTSNMPDMCGRLCPQEDQCEGSCVVGKKGDPVSIGALESFAADFVLNSTGHPRREVAPSTGKKVAVVGAGPAGMAIAEELAVLGHSLVVYERWPQPGGILIYGIPSFKLPKKIVDRKNEYLESMGIEFKCNVDIGTDITLDDLFKEGFDAIFLGTGTSAGSVIPIPNIDAPEVYVATDFLVRGNLTEEYLADDSPGVPFVGDKCAVIGGGDTAMDVLRTAVRLGAGEITCVYRRTTAEMPGSAKEFVHAEEEGVKFHYLAAPVEILLDDDGHVKGMSCIQMELGEPDESGRRRPVPKEGSEFDIEASSIVLALGYKPEKEIAQTTEGLKTDDWGLYIVDEETGKTSMDGVYAAGDNVTGPKTVVHAMVGARKSAEAIHEYLMNS